MAVIKLGQLLHRATTAPIDENNPLHVQQSGTIAGEYTTGDRYLVPGASFESPEIVNDGYRSVLIQGFLDGNAAGSIKLLANVGLRPISSVDIFQEITDVKGESVSAVSGARRTYRVDIRGVKKFKIVLTNNATYDATGRVTATFVR